MWLRVLWPCFRHCTSGIQLHCLLRYLHHCSSAHHDQPLMLTSPPPLVKSHAHCPALFIIFACSLLENDQADYTTQ